MTERKLDPDPSEKKLAARIRKLDQRMKIWEEKARKLLAR